MEQPPPRERPRVDTPRRSEIHRAAEVRTDSTSPASLEGFRPVASPAVRALLVVAGTLSVGLGVLGAFLPVLPTTPFLLLAAACYARASRRLYARLVGSPTFGPTIRAWQRSRAIPRRAKRVALLTIALSFGVSISVVGILWARIVMAALGITLLVWMARRPEPPDEAR